MPDRDWEKVATEKARRRIVGFIRMTRSRVVDWAAKGLGRNSTRFFDGFCPAVSL
jgi:hypothetical protein